MNVSDRLKRVLSYSEIEACKAVLGDFGESKEKTIIAKDIADSAGITRSVVVNAMRMLEAAGIVETKSLGMKGTRIKVLDRETLDSIMEF